MLVQGVVEGFPGKQQGGDVRNEVEMLRVSETLSEETRLGAGAWLAEGHNRHVGGW